MLVVTRKSKERIVFRRDGKVWAVMEVVRGEARIAFDFPPEISILREEVPYDAEQDEHRRQTLRRKT